MTVLQEIEALIKEFKTLLPFERMDNVPNMLCVPQDRLQELVDAIGIGTVHIGEEEETYTGPNKPNEKKKNLTVPADDWNRLRHEGMYIVVGGNQLQVWRIDVDAPKNRGEHPNKNKGKK